MINEIEQGYMDRTTQTIKKKKKLDEYNLRHSGVKNDNLSLLIVYLHSKELGSI